MITAADLIGAVTQPKQGPTTSGRSADPAVSGTGYRYWMVDGDGDRRISHHPSRHWTHMAGLTEGDPGSLLAPFGLSPWGPGWQSATCATCDVVGTADHNCGVAFFPSMDQMIHFMLPSDLQPSGPALDYLPEMLRWSVAIGRIETGGPWVPDLTQGAFRVPAARLTELWVAPGSSRTAVELAAEYGVPAHAGAGDPSSWLLSLVPWGASVVPRQPEPSPIPPIEDPSDLPSVLKSTNAMLEESRKVSAEAKDALAKYEAARAAAGQKG